MIILTLPEMKKNIVKKCYIFITFKLNVRFDLEPWNHAISNFTLNLTAAPFILWISSCIKELH